MGYVENNLGKDERVFARVTHSKAAICGSVIRAALVIGITFALFFAIGFLDDFLHSLGEAPSWFETSRRHSGLGNRNWYFVWIRVYFEMCFGCNVQSTYCDQ